MEGEKMGSHRKGFLKLKCLSPLKMLTSPLFEETFGATFFSPSLEDLGVLMIFEEKITSSKTSFHMALIYWQWTHIPEWSYACQHGQTMIMDMGELWMYWRWTHIPEWMYARQCLWLRLAINVGGKSFSKKFQNSAGHIP
jgi:hypothetical protein